MTRPPEARGPISRLLRPLLIVRNGRLTLPEEHLFLVLAVVIGLFAGAAVVCFRIVIEWSRLTLLGTALHPGWPAVVVVPAAVGVLVAILVKRVFPAVRGSGVNQTKAALYIYDGYVPFSTVIGKFLTASLAIGSGHSLGPEDPSLQIGAGLASAVGRGLQLSRDKLRLIAPIGAAAGLAAAFNAPISAVLFVIEEVIGRWSAAVLGAIVLSAVSAAVTARSFLGGEPLFRVPPYQLEHPNELFAYAALGLIGGVVSLLFVKQVCYLRARLRALPRWTSYLQPGVAGVLIGVIALFLPQVMGAGYEYMDQAMHDQYAWQILWALVLAKIVATTLSFVSGTPGGLFAPTLFMGAILGTAVGSVERLFFPELVQSVGAYGLVGMGVMFAGVLRAPMTSVFMILEVSGSYSIILPVIISNTIAYAISRRFQRVPLFDLLSRQDGLDLPSMEEQRELVTIRVEDAMRQPGRALQPSATVEEAQVEMLRSSLPAAIVELRPGVWTAVESETLTRTAASGGAASTLEDTLALSPLPALYPDQPLDAALRVVGSAPLVPVAHRADPFRLVGVVSLTDVLSAYDRAGANEP